jgi:hypothetical protein
MLMAAGVLTAYARRSVYDIKQGCPDFDAI